MENASGDVIPPTALAKKFPFSIEIKDHAVVENINPLFYNNKVIQTFMEQAVGDSIREKKVPLLLIHVSRQGDYMVVPHSSAVERRFSIADKPWMTTDLSYASEMLEETYTHKMTVVLFKDFLELVDVDSLLDMSPTWWYDWYEYLESADGLARTTGIANA